MPVRARMAMNGLAIALLAIVIAPAVAQASTELLVEYGGTYNETASKSLGGGKTEKTTVSYTWNEQGTAPVADERTDGSVAEEPLDHRHLLGGSHRARRKNHACCRRRKPSLPARSSRSGRKPPAEKPHIHATAPLPTKRRWTGRRKLQTVASLIRFGPSMKKSKKNRNSARSAKPRSIARRKNSSLTKLRRSIQADQLPNVELARRQITITGELKAQILLNITAARHHDSENHDQIAPAARAPARAARRRTS